MLRYYSMYYLWGGGEENLLSNLLWGGRFTVTKRHGGGEGSKKLPKLCYVINEWPLRLKPERQKNRSPNNQIAKKLFISLITFVFYSKIF